MNACPCCQPAHQVCSSLWYWSYCTCTVCLLQYLNGLTPPLKICTLKSVPHFVISALNFLQTFDRFCKHQVRTMMFKSIKNWETVNFSRLKCFFFINIPKFESVLFCVINGCSSKRLSALEWAFFKALYIIDLFCTFFFWGGGYF